MENNLHGTLVCIYGEGQNYIGLADLQELIDAGIENYRARNEGLEPMTAERKKAVLEG